MTLSINSEGHLSVSRHRATLSEVRAMFVDQAPFSDERDLIWDAFLVYHRQMLSLLPSARFWLDGGFVTHKTWAAPNDIDVCVIAPREEIEPVAALLEPLLTVVDAEPRFQPMAGLVDSFLAEASDRPQLSYWSRTWTRVTDLEGDLVDNMSKGYVEVVAR